MPWGFKVGSREPEGQRELLRAMMERRRLLDYSHDRVAKESGYYCRSMLSVLERTLQPKPPRRPRMSMRGMASIRNWLKATEALAAKLRKEYGLDDEKAA